MTLVDPDNPHAWRKLRVVVEVSVPPKSAAKEGDLLVEVRKHLPSVLKFRRSVHDIRGTEASVRIKSFSTFWPAFLRIERGIKTPSQIAKERKARRAQDSL